MGVDYYGYSCVRTEPISAKYRPATTTWAREDQEDFEREIAALKPEERALALMLNGVGRDASGGYVYPVEFERNDALTEAFYKEYEDKEDFIGVCWEKNRIYFRTADTKLAEAGRSYSGYADFYHVLARLHGGQAHHLPYMPPSTDAAPEHGFVEAEQCMNCLRGLDKVRDTFVLPSWTPDQADGDENTEMHADSWFFRDFYRVMYNGANGGVVRIS
jgi:hypothetical protein